MIFINRYMKYVSSKKHFTMQKMVTSTYSWQAFFYRAYAFVGVARMAGNSMEHIFMARVHLLINVLVVVDVREV